jgi:hypothetical protein
MNDHAEPFIALDNNSFRPSGAARGSLLTVKHAGGTLASWMLTVVADQPPTVAWGDNPGRQASSQQTRLPWQVSDDYGVTNLQAELRLRDRLDAPPMIVTIPLPGGSAKTAHGLSQPDLTARPWAGLAVIGRLVGHDAVGQAGTSSDATFELAERPFHNPVARLLIAARKSLSVHPDDRGEALEALDGLMQHNDLFAGDLGAFVALSGTYYGLVRNHSEGAVPEAQDMMWELALHMEEGQSEQSARALEQARQAARDAMDKAQQQPNDRTGRSWRRSWRNLAGD